MAVGAAGLLALGLASCTLTTPDGTSAPESAAPTSVAPTQTPNQADEAATSIPEYPRIPTDTVVATGPLVSAPGEATGEATDEATGEASGESTGGAPGRATLTAFVGTDFTLTLSGFRAAPGHLSLAFVTKSTASVDGCARASSPFQNLGTVTTAADQTVTVSLNDGLTEGDPTNFTRVVVLSDADTGDCAGRRVVASADLTWTWPAHRYTPATLSAVDHGVREGARGSTTVVDGKPVSYLVAVGDTRNGILSRFGLDVDQVLYLNPGFFSDREAFVAKFGYTWNLSLADR